MGLESTAPRRRRDRYMSWVLLLALLPTLGFVGHINLQVELPWTDMYLGLPSPHTHGGTGAGSADEGEHERHCHTGLSTCSDAPLTGLTGFALLSEATALLGAGALVLVLALAGAGQLRGLTVKPEWRPPRLLPA